VVMVLHMGIWYLVSVIKVDFLPKVIHDTFNNPKFHKSGYIRTLFALFLLSYNSILQMAVSFFECVHVSNGVSVLAAIPSVTCQDSEYKRMEGVFYFLLIFIVVGGPLTLLAFLVNNWHHKRLNIPKHVKRYGVLFEMYRDNRFFWEFVVLARRAILLTINTVVVTNRSAGLSALSTANVLVLLLHVAMWPYEKEWPNYVELFSLSILCVITNTLNGESLPLANNTALGVSLLILIPCLLMIADVIRRRTERISHRLRVSQSKLKIRDGADTPPADDVEMAGVSTPKKQRLSRSPGASRSSSRTPSRTHSRSPSPVPSIDELGEEAVHVDLAVLDSKRPDQPKRKKRHEPETATNGNHDQDHETSPSPELEAGADE